MDLDMERAKHLIAQRDEIDAELKVIFSGGERNGSRKPQKCSKCGDEGHSARTCTKQTELSGT